MIPQHVRERSIMGVFINTRSPHVAGAVQRGVTAVRYLHNLPDSETDMNVCSTQTKGCN